MARATFVPPPSDTNATHYLSLPLVSNGPNGTVIFPADDLPLPSGAYKLLILPAHYFVTDAAFEHDIPPPEDDVKPAHPIVFYHLDGPFKTASELACHLVMQCNGGKGHIGVPGPRPQGLALGIQVSGYFRTNGDVHAAAQARILQIHSLILREKLQFAAPLVVSS